MWYKYVNRPITDQMRLFRNCNLKFNQDDFGMTHNKTMSPLKEFLFTAARSEGPLRGYSFALYMGLIPALLYLKDRFYDAPRAEEKRLEAQRINDEQNRLARERLFYNNLGAPSNPSRSLDELMIFVSSSEAMERNAQYLNYGLDLNADQMKGLDSYLSENDERMIDLLSESKKKKGGH